MEVLGLIPAPSTGFMCKYFLNLSFSVEKTELLRSKKWLGDGEKRVLFRTVDFFTWDTWDVRKNKLFPERAYQLKGLDFSKSMLTTEGLFKE